MVGIGALGLSKAFYSVEPELLLPNSWEGNLLNKSNEMYRICNGLKITC